MDPTARIVVPEGMLKAAVDSWISNGDAAYKEYAEMAKANISDLKDALESALRWLSENPIMPSDEQIFDIAKAVKLPGLPNNRGCEQFKRIATDWQRRMFLAPEPEYTSEREVIDAWLKRHQSNTSRVSLVGDAMAQELLDALEAYRRGQKAGKP